MWSLVCLPYEDPYNVSFLMICRAGLFWSSEGAVALGYPESSKRGKYMKYAQHHDIPPTTSDFATAFG